MIVYEDIAEIDRMITACRAMGGVAVEWAYYWENDEDSVGNVLLINDQGQTITIPYIEHTGYFQADYDLAEALNNYIDDYGVLRFDFATRRITQIAECYIPFPELVVTPLPHPKELRTVE